MHATYAVQTCENTRSAAQAHLGWPRHVRSQTLGRHVASNRLALQVERAKLEAYFAERGFVRRCAPAADAQGWELYARPEEGKIDRWKRNSSAELLLRQPATARASLASAAAADTIHGLAVVVAKDKVASVAEAEVLGAIIAQLETNTHHGDSALEEEE